MTTVPSPDVRSICAGSRPTVSQCWTRIASLRLHVLDPAADVVEVAVARHELERHVDPATADQDGQGRLDGRRIVADLVLGVARATRRGRSPRSMPRMIGRASPSQRSRSGKPSPKGMPKASCSGSNQAAPSPRIARPFEMWSRVVTILAVNAGAGTCSRRPSGRSGSARSPAPRPRAEPTLEDGAVRVAHDRVQVVPGPERVVAQPIGPQPGLQQLRPGRVLAPAQGAQPDGRRPQDQLAAVNASA